MKVIDFTLELLMAQGDALNRLAVWVGEDELVELLEQAGSRVSAVPATRPAWLSAGMSFHPNAESSSSYRRLQGAVDELGLSPRLEFHLWAYPHYRVIIENVIELDSLVASHSIPLWVDEACSAARAWVETLDLDSDRSAKAQALTQNSWARFRTRVLESIGQKRLSAVEPIS